METFGLDIGASAVKLWGKDGGVSLPSQVATIGRVGGLQAAGIKSAKPPMRIDNLYVGEGAHGWGVPVENLDFERFAGNPEIKALVGGAFALYASNYELPEEAVLTVGVPIDVLSGETAKKNADEIRRWLAGDFRWQVSGQTEQFIKLPAGSLKVTAQPFGAIFDHLVQDNLTPAPLDYKGEVAIISIGFQTIELLVMDGQKVIQKLTKSSQDGVRRLVEMSGTNYRSLAESDEVLRKDPDERAKSMQLWWSAVNGLLEATWGNTWKRFNKILATGGGSLYLTERLEKKFGGKLIFTTDMVMATAHGLYKYGVVSQKKE